MPFTGGFTVKKTTVIIAAAGSGERMGLGYNKLLKEISGKPIIAHTILAFEKCRFVNDIIISASQTDMERILDIIRTEKFKKVKKIIQGGKTRTKSVHAALSAIDKTDIVMVHDGARPFISQKVIKQTLLDVEQTGATIVAVPVTDTIKEGQDFIEKTLDRTKLWSIQTPQVFKFDILKKAYETGESATDDASLVEKIGIKVKITQGEYQNIKITTPHDILVAEALLEKR